MKTLELDFASSPLLTHSFLQGHFWLQNYFILLNYYALKCLTVLYVEQDGNFKQQSYSRLIESYSGGCRFARKQKIEKQTRNVQKMKKSKFCSQDGMGQS